MVGVTNIASALLTGLLLVAIVVALLRLRDWRRYTPGTADEPGGRLDRGYGLLAAAASRETTWTLGFLLLALGVGAAALLFLAGGPTGQMAGVAAALLGVLVLCGFLVLGVYRTIRFRGRTSAEAVAVSAWVVGSLFVLAVSINLLLA
ncbi:hypothetical protein ACFQPA_00795 [Halomarina halobia]|uniref:DUF3784 domain-containing protein n=1 Tax=Halomarina halobia TaxID=3033386 RepID=A0ABD6A729_9EURY|nr:hypothetical protein [Halomarina sp. PSR21]